MAGTLGRSGDRPLVGERRRYVRQPHRGVGDAKLRPGGEVRVLDLSACGARIEADARMAPGAHVELRLPGAHSIPLIRALVVRCHVSALIGGERVRYTAGLEFQRALEWLPHGVSWNDAGGRLPQRPVG